MAKELTLKEKLELLDQVTLELSKKYGKESNLIRSRDDGVIEIPRWKVSSPGLSWLLGGGIPKGRIIEVYGLESSGKTSLALLTGADVQKEGGMIALVDAEHSFDFEYAEKLGVDTSPNKFRLIQPDTTEQSFDVIESCLSIFDYIIVDSVSALVPKAELEGGYGESHMGLQARSMSQGLRKIVGKLSDSGATIIFINQIRMKIGVVFGNPEESTGGKALKFYSSIRLETRKGYDADAKDSKEAPTGITVKVKNIKNKVAPPFKKIEMDLNFENGFNTDKEYIDFAVTYGIINKSGSWYSYGTERIGQGIDKTILWVKNNPDIFQEIKEKVDNVLFPKKENISSQQQSQQIENANQKEVKVENVVKNVFPEIEKLKERTKVPTRKTSSNNNSSSEELVIEET